jgi:DNA polymerase
MEQDWEKWLRAAEVARARGSVERAIVLEAKGVREGIKACEQCHLCETRTQAVPWSGPIRRGVMVIGEAPGPVEDKAGVPFVGPAGKLLDHLLEVAGLPRDEVMVANAVCCLPTGGDRRPRTPKKEEVEACNGWLRRQIMVGDPWLIVVTGNVALGAVSRLLGRTIRSGIGTLHGRGWWEQGKVWFPVLHPAWALRNGQRGVRVCEEDWAMIGELVSAEVLMAAGTEPLPQSGWEKVIKQLAERGWAEAYAPLFGEMIAVTRGLSIPEGRALRFPRYTIKELELLAKGRAEGWDWTNEELEAAHRVKKVLGGEVVG